MATVHSNLGVPAAFVSGNGWEESSIRFYTVWGIPTCDIFTNLEQIHLLRVDLRIVTTIASPVFRVP